MGYNFSSINRSKTLAKKKLVFNDKVAFGFWKIFSIILLMFSFFFGLVLINVLVKDGFYIYKLFIILFTILPLLGLFSSSKLKKVNIKGLNINIIAKLYSDSNKYFLKKEKSMLFIQPRHQFFSFYSPTTIVIFFDKDAVFINCSTYMTGFQIHTKVRSLIFFFYDMMNERRLINKLRCYKN